MQDDEDDEYAEINERLRRENPQEYGPDGKCKHRKIRDKAGGGKVCWWCGRILQRAAGEIPFCELPDGEYFLSAYDDEDEAVLWKKDSTRTYKHRRMDSYRPDKPHLEAGHGPLSPVIPVKLIQSLN